MTIVVSISRKRGEEVESLIFGLVSLVVLIPLLMFLPLGLKAKGKFTIIVVSFLIAILGILAKNTFSLWQSGLMVVLLAFLAAYIMDKRSGSTLFVHIMPEKKVSMVEDKAVEENTIKLEETEPILPEFIPDPMEVNQNIEQEALKPEPYVEKIDFENEDLLTKEEVITTNNTDFSSDDELEADISFLMNREVLDDENLEINTDESTNSLNYMEEIEKLLAADVEIEDKASQQQQSNITTSLEEVDSSNEQQENESNAALLEVAAGLAELSFDDSTSEKNHEQDQNGRETTIATTWEEDEIEPLHFDDVPASLKLTSETKQIKKEEK